MPTETGAIMLENPRDRMRGMLDWCEDRLRSHPNDLESLVQIAQALWDMKKKTLAVDYLKRALTHHPGDPRLREMIQLYSEELAAPGPWAARARSRRMTR